MMAKRLYLGRTTRLDEYELGTAKKDWHPDYGFGSCLKFFCPEPFEKYTGIVLKPGEIRRVKSITIDLEEPS